jgi:signal transduction histidine kinase
MDNLQKLQVHLRAHMATVLIINNALLVGGWWVGIHVLHLDSTECLAMLAVLALVLVLIIAAVTTKYVIQPIRLIWQAVLHISPDTANSAAPDLRQAHLGKELVTNLISHVYQIANVSQSVEQFSAAQPGTGDLSSDFIGNSLPLPLAVLDKNMNVVFANAALLQYVHRVATDTTGQNIYTILDMSFPNEQTFDTWLAHVKDKKVTATKTWERVRITLDESKTTRLFDLVAYYNADNPQGFEVMLTLFDRTRQYAQDDQALSFVALAVHELRTPLTLLRGYIDVFEEEFDGKLDDELTGFMRKMKAAAQQLAAFTSNVLNVAKFENDQLILKLHEAQWPPLLTAAVRDMELRAKVRGISLNLTIDGELPAVGVDSVSIYEVIANLIDNAIKYSGTSTSIEIHSFITTDGLVETTVKDFGVGVPESAVPNLFDKFYRDHHNRSQVGGTGMGLYLSKAIIQAHGGNIWVQTKEGKGSTFGFTLLPYSQVADPGKKGDNSDVVRTAHGWIKNHSMYRR